MNRVTLLGRLGADPEIRITQTGDKIANIRIATSERWKDKSSGETKERTEWHTVTAFGPLASLIERFARKGLRIMVEGPQRTRKWQDQQGNDRYSTEVVLSGFGCRVDIIDWPDSEGGSQQQSGGNDYATPRVDGYDDEIPFD